MEELVVEVRPLAEEELPTLERRINLDSGNADKHRRRLAQQEAGDAVYLVAWKGDMPVGHALLVCDGATNPELGAKLNGCPNVEDVFVVPELRSRGVGSGR